MKVLSAQETAALLPYPALAEQLRMVLADKRAGRATAPPRLQVPLAGGGVLLLMPAADDELAITNLVAVHIWTPWARGWVCGRSSSFRARRLTRRIWQLMHARRDWMPTR